MKWLIANRRARRLIHPGAMLSVLREAAAKHGILVRETGCIDELTETAREIRARGASSVILAGGDGTHSAGVTALAKVFDDRPPPLALLPAGTVCTVARNWGYRGTAEAHARELLDAVGRGECSRSLRPCLRVGDQLGFIFGAGLVKNFFDVYDSRGSRGLVDAASLVARVFVGSFVGGALSQQVLRRSHARLTLEDGSSFEGNFSLVLASVVPNVGLHLKVAPRAGVGDHFHLVASRLPGWALAPQLPLTLTGQKLRGLGHLDALAKSFSLEFSSERGGYVLDGESYGARAIRVAVGPTWTLLSSPRARERVRAR